MNGNNLKIMMDGFGEQGLGDDLKHITSDLTQVKMRDRGSQGLDRGIAPQLDGPTL